MSVQLHPDVETPDKESLCCPIYAQLCHNFLNARQRKDDEHPYGIEEGDETSLRLKNTAHGSAPATTGTVTGEGGSGSDGLLLDYLKKSGGDMTGKLSVNYGFEVGIGNTRTLETYLQDITDPEGVVAAIEYGIRITGNLEIGGDSLHIGGRQSPRYDADKVTATINASHIDFLDVTVHSKGAWIIGDEDTRISTSPTRLTVGGQDIYHRGNANTDTVDWTMRGGMVRRNLTVRGSTVMDGGLKALQGMELGDKGKRLLSLLEEDVVLGGFLSSLDGSGIRIGDVPILLCTDKDKIQFGSIGGGPLLGGDHTPEIRLFSGISGVDGECLMLSPYGKVCFPGSLIIRHSYGTDLFSSYRVDTSDEGIAIHRRLWMGTTEGFMSTGDRERVSFSSEITYEKEDVRTAIPHSTDLSHHPSVSCYAPQNHHSELFHIRTDADFAMVAVPLEATGHIGIHASPTWITDRILYLTEALRLQVVEDGTRHYGNSVFAGSLSPEFFLPGLSGSGWAVCQNRTTGGVSATFDEVVVRRKSRVYELEVEKTSVTNGSFWVSDSCSGDTVEKLS